MHARPHQVDTHQPRKHHANDDGEQTQAIILLPDYLVIEAEYVLANEPLRCSVMRSMRENLGHCVHLSITALLLAA